MKAHNRNMLMKAAGQLGIDLSTTQVDAVGCYLQLLLQENRKYNLTADADEDEIVLRHVIDSLTASLYIDPESTLLDLGSGAGFPGLPLKICLPDLKVTLLETKKKRLRFLEKVCSRLNLNKIFLLGGRAETHAHDPRYRAGYSVVTARAVSHLGVLAELALPFLKISGRLLAYKGPDPRAEVAESREAIKIMGGTLEGIHPVELSPLKERLSGTIVEIRLLKYPPANYPRRSGIPEKRPL